MADIHGNLQALEAVLRYTRNQGISNYIIAGDLISDCPNPNEVIDVIKGLTPWVIKGNREESIIELLEDHKNKWHLYSQFNSMVWTGRQLTEPNRIYIQQLQEQMVVSPENSIDIRVVHGSPNHIYEHLFFHDKVRIKEVMNELEEAILVCGHTHEQWHMSVEDKLMINPGSVGVSFNDHSTAEFTILSIENDQWHVEEKHVKYDLSDLVQAYLDNGIKQRDDIWSTLILQSLKDGVNRNSEFIKYAKSISMASGFGAYKHIPNEIWDDCSKLWRDRFKL